MKSTQKGFSAVAVLVILLVIAAVAFSAWWVFVRSSKDASNTDTNTTQSSNEQDTTGGSESDDENDTDVQYLVIDEWGVKLPLAVETLNAYYEFRDGYAYLSLSQYKDTNCAADKTTLGAITRFDNDDVSETTGETYLSMFPDVPKIGDYYYNYTSPQADCMGDEPGRIETTNIRQIFRTSAAGIVAD